LPCRRSERYAGVAPMNLLQGSTATQLLRLTHYLQCFSLTKPHLIHKMPKYLMVL
jgi:hypothetical protein